MTTPAAEPAGGRPDAEHGAPEGTRSRAPQRGRPVLGGLFGLLFGLFLTFDLLMLGTFPLESVLVVVLPLLMLVGGAALGWFAPLRFLRR